MIVIASTIVARLLEDEFDDTEHYIGKVNTGTVDDVLTALKFTKSYRQHWERKVPLNHTQFPLAFGQPDPHQCRVVRIDVGPSSSPKYAFDTGLELQVSYTPEGLALSSSRNCEDTSIFSQDGRISGRGNLAARLNHVIPFLIEAIAGADAAKHQDIYKFFNDIDKRWGRQPNRIIRRKKKQ